MNSAKSLHFPRTFLDELQRRLVPSEVIKRYIRLQRKGADYWGNCPFHQEKTPSFSVNDQKGFYHCFGCGVHGTVIDFVMAHTGLSFKEAVEKLALEAGMTLPKISPEMAARESREQDLYEVLRLSHLWYQKQLYTQEAFAAREYLARRKLTEETIEKFGLGFAPGKKHALFQDLKKEGVTEEQLVAVGLLKKGENGELYDYFRGRILFPIMDIRNRVIAFGGRILGEGQPKYLNSPETLFFKKGEVLYAENFARKEAFKRNSVIVTEGYMDVIALHMAGFTHSVASLGTAVTTEHLQHLWRIANEPIVCLDGDIAGYKAIERVIENVLPILSPGYSLQFILLPEGYDPDDLIQSYGREAMEKLLAQPIPLSEMIWRTETAKAPLATPEQKAALEKRFDTLIQKIQHKEVINYYRSYFKEQLWHKIKRYGGGNKGKAAGGYVPKNDTSTFTSGPKILTLTEIERYQYTLLALILQYESLLEIGEIEEYFSIIDYSGTRFSALHQMIITTKYHASYGGEVGESLRKHLEKRGFSDDIQYLCGPSSTFLDTITKWDHEQAKNIWLLTLYKYQYVMMQQEYGQYCRTMLEDPSMESKAAALFQHTEEVKRKIMRLEQLLAEEAI